MLYNLVEDIFKKRFEYNPKTIKRIHEEIEGFVDFPPENIPTWDELLKSGNLTPGRSYLCLVKASDLYSDDEYNRVSEINHQAVINYVKKKKGFSYNSANTLFAYYRKGKIVLTQGNHRTLMALLAAIKTNPYLVVNVYIHYETLDLRELERIESVNFTDDSLARTGMSATSKFKGAYMAQEKWAIDIYSFLKEYKISVGGTNACKNGPLAPFIAEKSLESFPKFQEAYDCDTSLNHRYLRMSLQSLVKNIKEPEINAVLLNSLVIFLKHFESKLIKVPDYTLDDFLNFVFNVFKVNGVGNFLKQKDIVKAGSAKFRPYHYYASKLVILFNIYAESKKVKVRKNSTYAISSDCKEWQNFVLSVDEDLLPIYKVYGAIG